MTLPSRYSVKQFIRSRTGLVCLGTFALAAIFLITTHTSHVLNILPFAVLLLCPLLHLFMHRGHGHAGHPATEDASQTGIPAITPEIPQ